MRTLLAALAAAALACAGAPPRPQPLPAGLDDRAARASLSRFAEALEAGRLEEAHALLSERWRHVYTPGRLRLDLAGAGPLAREAAARALAAARAGAPVERDGATARLPLDGGGAAVLVAEGGAWRVDGLE